MHPRVFAYMCTYVHSRICVRMCICVYVYVCAQAYMCTYVHPRICVRMCNVRVHMCVPSDASWRGSAGQRGRRLPGTNSLLAWFI